MEQSIDYRQSKRASTALRALRAYKEDLDQAIEAFSVYAATHQRRGTIDILVDRRKLINGRCLKG